MVPACDSIRVCLSYESCEENDVRLAGWYFGLHLDLIVEYTATRDEVADLIQGKFGDDVFFAGTGYIEFLSSRLPCLNSHKAKAGKALRRGGFIR